MRASQGRLTSDARTMRDAKKTLSASLAGGVKEILGTAQSVGCTIDVQEIVSCGPEGMK
jgi:ribosomal protein L11